MEIKIEARNYNIDEIFKLAQERLDKRIDEIYKEEYDKLFSFYVGNSPWFLFTNLMILHKAIALHKYCVFNYMIEKQLKKLE